MKLTLGDGYPFPYPQNTTEEQSESWSLEAPEHRVTLEGVQSFEWRFTLTVMFESREAFNVAQKATGWKDWEWERCILEATVSVEDAREFPAVVIGDKAYCQIFIEA